MPNSSRWRFEAILTRREKKRHRPDRCLKGRKTDWYKNGLIPISSKSVLKRPKTELYKNVFMPNSSKLRFEAILTRRDKERHHERKTGKKWLPFFFLVDPNLAEINRNPIHFLVTPALRNMCSILYHFCDGVSSSQVHGFEASS